MKFWSSPRKFSQKSLKWKTVMKIKFHEEKITFGIYKGVDFGMKFWSSPLKFSQKSLKWKMFED